jgi:hypothetical protein
MSIALDRYVTHPRPAHSLGDRLSIDVVVLVGLHKRLHILSRHQPHIVPLITQCATKVMRASAGFHPYQPHLQVGRKTQQLGTRELLPNHGLARDV